MVPNANSRHFLLKAKQRDLITAVGGIDRASGICSYGKSTVGRWANADSPELMPLDAIFALEEECGRFDMSEAIAMSRGRRFAETEISEAASGSVMAVHAKAVERMSELMTTAAAAFADGKVTPAEAAGIDRALSAMEREARNYRAVIAGARGEGGLSLVGGAA